MKLTKLLGMLACALLCMFTLVGCGSMSPYGVKVTTMPTLNIDKDENSLPVELRVYELTDATAFENATFRQLWEHDDQVLGKTMLDKQVLMVNPNTITNIKLKHDGHAKFIGVMAVFRNLNHSSWRVVHPIGKIGSLAITIDNNKLLLNTK